MAGWDVLFTREGRQVDGVAEAELKRLLKSGELRPEDCLRRAGETRWRQVAELKGGAKAAVAAVEEPAPAEAAPVVVATVPSPLPTSSPDDEDDAEVDFGSHAAQEHLDMTPMVDVVLLLLLFFMVTASYSIQKIMTMTKPDPKQEKSRIDVKPDLAKEYVMIQIDEKNQIFVDSEGVRGRSSIKAAVDRAAKEGNKQKAMVIAEGKAFHGTCVRVLDGVREAGITTIVYQVRDD